MALDILMKGPSLDWTEDNQLYDCFKALLKRAEMPTTDMVLKKELQESICHCIWAWLGETGRTHIEASGLTCDDANSIQCTLDILKGHCKPKSNGIVTATAYKQPVQGDLDLPESIEKYSKEVTEACNFSTAYDKCNSIQLGRRNKWVYERCIKVGDQLTCADLIWIASDVYNSDRQPSIMQSLTVTTTVATAVQNPSVTKLHMVKAKHRKEEM